MRIVDDPIPLLLGLPVEVDPSFPVGVIGFKDGDEIVGYLEFDATHD